MARQALIVLGRGLADLWDNLLVLVVANLAWALALLPGVSLLVFVPGLGLWLGLILLVLLLGPATLALYSFTIEVTRREKIEFGEFWRGLKQYYRRGWVVGLVNAVFTILAIFNLIFYLSPGISNSPLGLGIILWAYISFIWFCMQLYLWPLAVRMEQFRLGIWLRNAFLAAFKYPALTLIVGLVMAIFFFVSFLVAFIPVVVFGMGYHALVSNRALSVVLVKERERAEALQKKGEQSSYAVDVPPLPEPETPSRPVYSTRNAPPGVKRRGTSEDSKE